MEARKEFISQQIVEHSNSQRSLFNTVLTLSAPMTYNPLPPALPSQPNIADCFASFFSEKVDNIARTFNRVPFLTPDGSGTRPVGAQGCRPECRLGEFETVTEDYVESLRAVEATPMYY